MAILAIDVSRYQGHIDWPAVRAAGIAGAWIKVGGGDGFRAPGLYADSRARENLAGAAAAGLPFGTYYFCDSGRSAIAQARHAVDCGHGSGDLLPMADLETNNGGLSERQLDEWLTVFCDELRRLTGRESIWYGGHDTGVGHTDAAPECPCWIANYGPNHNSLTPPHLTGRLSDGQGGPAVPPAWRTYDVWQFSSNARLPGIPENTVDVNVVRPAFWLAMSGGVDIRRLRMKAISVPQSGAEWVLVFDGFGRPRRYGLTGTDAGEAMHAAYLDGSVSLEGPAADWFWALPEANEVTADVGALQLTMKVLSYIRDEVLPKLGSEK